MRNMLNTIQKKLSSREDLVLVTVIASSGATPRGAGARMLVGKEGRICGTIGGGAVEYRSEQIAAKVLEEKTSLGHDFTLTKDDVQNLGMICGGACDVFFHFLPAGDAHTLSLCSRAAEEFRKGSDLWLLTDVGTQGTMGLIHRRTDSGASRSRRVWFPPGTRNGPATFSPNRSTPPAKSASSAAVMWPRSWSRSWPMWASGASSWTTAPSSPSRSCSPVQKP